MPRATSQKMKSQPAERDNEADDESGSGPSLSDRASSGMRAARHLQKAATGGKLRKGFSLWRASRELPVVASGAGNFFKQHPLPLALLGGALTTAALLYTARSMGAFDSNAEGDESEPQGRAEDESREETNEGNEDEDNRS
jgi:hypothetical protein